MPPKAPNLKFKPKLVMQSTQFAAAVPSAMTDYDDLTMLQLSRLQREEVEVEANEEATADQQQQQSHSEVDTNVGSRGGGQSIGGGSSSSGAGARGNTESGIATGAKTRAARGAGGGGPQLSAHAALQQASTRYVDVFTYPVTTERFQPNTINSIVGDGMTGGDLYATMYHPTPLDSSLPARMRSGIKSESKVEGDDTQPPQDTLDGTAFLKEGSDELRRCYAANARFYRETLAPSLGHFESSSMAATGEFAQPATSSSSHHHAAAEGPLVWMQLPRFFTNQPFALNQLPPGKVGELKVLRSGRMVMDIAGVYYDVAVEGYSPGDDGPCSMVAVTQPPQFSNDPASKASCYQLGMLEKKLVCTPTIGKI